MKSLTSLNLLKSLGIALLFVGVAPLLPVIALMHLSAWLGKESNDEVEARSGSDFESLANCTLAT